MIIHALFKCDVPQALPLCLLYKIGTSFAYCCYKSLVNSIRVLKAFKLPGRPCQCHRVLTICQNDVSLSVLSVNEGFGTDLYL